MVYHLDNVPRLEYNLARDNIYLLANNKLSQKDSVLFELPLKDHNNILGDDVGRMLDDQDDQDDREEAANFENNLWDLFLRGQRHQAHSNQIDILLPWLLRHEPLQRLPTLS